MENKNEILKAIEELRKLAYSIDACMEDLEDAMINDDEDLIVLSSVRMDSVIYNAKEIKDKISNLYE